MPLNNQPYIPFYVKDWLTNGKLKLCTPAAHGLMINIMCLLHKEENYGSILLRQKFKQSEQQIKNFATMFDRLLAFNLLEIQPALEELIEEKILIIDGDCLSCTRMVNDGILSLKRAKSGSKGGNKTKEKFATAKGVANPVIVSEDENGVVDDIVDLRDGRFESFMNNYGKRIDERECAILWRMLRPQDRDMIEKILPLYIEATPEVKYRKSPKNFLLGKCWLDRDIIKNFEENNTDWVKEKLEKLGRS